jgi:hypothetical protein
MPRKAVRVMKARKSSRLQCGCYVLRGQQIVRRGGRWTCLPCGLIPPDAEKPRQGPLEKDPASALR